VIGATVNATGSFVMRADKVGSATLLARIVAMVAQAQRSRAPIQKLADVVSGYFVPAVVAVAAVTAVVWATVGPEPRTAHAIVNAVAVLIIACPCALGLATRCRSWWRWGAAPPPACCSRTPRRSRYCAAWTRWSWTRPARSPAAGRNWRGPARDRLGRGGAAARGGEPRAGERAPARGRHRRRRAREGDSDHERESFEARIGKGVVGRVEGRTVALGNTALLADLGVAAGEAAGRADALRAEGQTVMFVAVDGALAGSSASQTRSRTRRPTRFANCTPRAFASSC
jgi:Cu+-exporting ATPase